MLHIPYFPYVMYHGHGVSMPKTTENFEDMRKNLDAGFRLTVSEKPEPEAAKDASDMLRLLTEHEAKQKAQDRITDKRL